MSEEINETVLNFTQRRQRALVMRKYRAKIEAARRRMSHRIASQDKLMIRSRKKAIDLIRTRVAGERGANYADLPVSEKMVIDAKVEKRKAIIARLARKLLPMVRRADLDRVMHTSHNSDSVSNLPVVKQHNEDINYEFEKLFNTDENIKNTRYLQMKNSDGTMNYDRRLKVFRHIIESDSALISDLQLYEKRINEEFQSIFK